MRKSSRKLNIMLGLISAMLLLPLCSCQTDFRHPADYTFDAENSEKTYTLDLSGMELPDTSKTFVFEVENTSGCEQERSQRS